MNRRKPLKRKTRLRARNPKRGGSRFPHRRDPAYCAWIRTLPCALRHLWESIGGTAPCQGPTECAHVKTRGVGGDDRGNTVPLCTRHHRQQHALGIKSFAVAYGVDLGALARATWDAYPKRDA